MAQASARLSGSRSGPRGLGTELQRAGNDQECLEQGPKDGTGRKEPDVRRLRVAIVNDYEVIVAGVMAMLAPQRHRVDVVELDVQQNPENTVDVALFDSYGQLGLGLHRIQSLVADERVGSVAVYTWSLTTASREAAFGAGPGA